MKFQVYFLYKRADFCGGISYNGLIWPIYLKYFAPTTLKINEDYLKYCETISKFKFLPAPVSKTQVFIMTIKQWKGQD